MRGHVSRSQQAFTFPPQIYSFVAECRKSGEASQHTNENQRARFGGEDAARLSQLRKETNSKTAQQVDRQSAIRKVNTATQTLHEATDGIAEDGSDKTTHTCQK